MVRSDEGEQDIRRDMMAVLTLLETDNLQNPSKLTAKHVDKVRRIVHPKARPFPFHIKTYYLSDANYPTDKQSQTDNPSLV